MRVPDVVQPARPDARLRAKRTEGLGEPVRGDRRPEFVVEDQVAVEVGVAGELALGELR